MKIKGFLKLVILPISAVMIIGNLSILHIFALDKQQDDQSIKKTDTKVIWTKEDFYLDLETGTKILERRPTDGSIPMGLTEQGKKKLERANGYLEIPEGIVEIDGKSFCYYYKNKGVHIRHIKFPSTLKKIGFGAFVGNDITGEVIIPEGVEEVSHMAFRDNEINKVVLPSTLKVLGLQSFGWNHINEIETHCDLTKITTKNYGSSNISDDPRNSSPFASQTLTDIIMVPDKEHVGKLKDKAVQRPFIKFTGNKVNKGSFLEVYNGDNGNFFVDDMGHKGKNKDEFIFTKGGNGEIWSVLSVNGYMYNMLGWGKLKMRAALPLQITHTFENTDNSQERLPQEILDILPKSYQAYETTDVVAPNLNITELDDPNGKGKWVFKGWQKDKFTNINSDVKFVGLWQLNKVHKVSYLFTSQTKNKALDPEVLAKKPQDELVLQGKKVAVPKNYENIKVHDGIWLFKGWQPIQEQTVNDKDITFTGTWAFKEVQAWSMTNNIPNLVVKNAEIKVGETLDLYSLIQRADDKEDGPQLNKQVVIDKGQFDATKAGEYVIKYRLTDKQKASVEKEAIVKVIKTYQLEYKFKSATKDKELPVQVMQLLPATKKDLQKGTVVKSVKLAKTSVAVEGGTWIFKGFAKDEVTIQDKDEVIVGTWEFKVNPSTVDREKHNPVDNHKIVNTKDGNSNQMMYWIILWLSIGMIPLLKKSQIIKNK